ncbi:beta-ketoacyl synthase chain length factor, partial [Pseudomonas viridiflava]|uniref:beta-ketoacyl synthase chain length factor n=1 Tax=Pseudomonas viridiflava TaxID=33069 RepID=UPI001F11CBBB
MARWRAWAPGLASADEWEQWSRTPRQLQDSNEAPDVSFLPAMQRRRLGRMARMAFAVGWPLSEDHERMPLVFVSRHGETPRTFEILRDLAADEPMSPTQFSLSVH